MYRLKAGIKMDPERRWNLPDRVFFGHGACHILAGVYLARPPLWGFYAERVIPVGEQPGSHIYVTDGVVAFDYHGYTLRHRLLAHHERNWSSLVEGWSCEIVRVTFDLLSTADLNERKMLGPDQYLQDALPRARAFIERRDHAAGAAKARAFSQRSWFAADGNEIVSASGSHRAAKGLAASDRAQDTLATMGSAMTDGTTRRVV